MHSHNLQDILLAERRKISLPQTKINLPNTDFIDNADDCGLTPQLSFMEIPDCRVGKNKMTKNQSNASLNNIPSMGTQEDEAKPKRQVSKMFSGASLDNSDTHSNASSRFNRRDSVSA